jgi:hypothetical protein
MDQLVIGCTPNLEKLSIQEQGNGPRIIRVLDAPKIQILDCLRTDMMSTVQMGKTTFQVTD